jgi:hypothetical protein
VRPTYRTGVLLPSRCCILYIFFSTNISAEYFKHAALSLFFSSKCHLFYNATFFGSCIIHILHTVCTKIQMWNSGPKRLKTQSVPRSKHFCLSYKNQSVYDVYSKGRGLFWDPYKTLNAKRAPCRIFEFLTWYYVKEPLGFKRLIIKRNDINFCLKELTHWM